MPPQNMPFWHMDYFELMADSGKALKTGHLFSFCEKKKEISICKDVSYFQYQKEEVSLCILSQGEGTDLNL